MAASAPQPELTLLCGRDRAALEKNAGQLGFAEWSDDWHAVIARPDIDLVDICTPGAMHAEVAIAALDAGKHVLCEKPLANTMEEARELTAAAERARVDGHFAMVGFNYRRAPALALARSLISGGRLGAVRHVRATYLQDWLVDASFPLTWRLDSSQAGSGALGDLGAHIVDLTHFLTGDSIVEVASILGTFVKKRPLAESAIGLDASADQDGQVGAVDVDDACVTVARLGGGGLASFEATRMAPGRKNALTIEVNGARGSLRFELERLNELQLYEIGMPTEGFQTLLVTNPADPYVGQWWPPGHILGWEHTFVHQCQDLLKALTDGRQPEPSFTDGLRVQAVLDAIARSAAGHRWISVDAITG
jgi:predicted dehydrogenase